MTAKKEEVKKESVKKVEPTKEEPKNNSNKPTVSDFKTLIKGTELKLNEQKLTNAVKFDRNICYIRDSRYGISVWYAIGKNANTTKQIKTMDQLTAFVESLKEHVKKTQEEAQKKA